MISHDCREPANVLCCLLGFKMCQEEEEHWEKLCSSAAERSPLHSSFSKVQKSLSVLCGREGEEARTFLAFEEM